MGKKKKLGRAIKSFEERIKEHEKKISEYPGKKDYLKEYWEGEIKNYKEQIEKLKKKLGKEK